VKDISLVMAGHVDHGKSTLLAQLLLSGHFFAGDHVVKIRRLCQKAGKNFEPAFLLDAFREEQDQGVTIDITRTRLKTTDRDYIMIDAPGHREFLKNMLSGASQARGAILVVDVEEGICRETKSHLCLLSFLDLEQLVVVVNKMDLLPEEKAQETFEKRRRELEKLLKNFSLQSRHVLPVSARENINISRDSSSFPWYDGEDLLSLLEQLPFQENDLQKKTFLMPLQSVLKFDNRRILCGRLEQGRIQNGEEVIFSPSGKRGRIKSLEGWPKKPKDFFAGQSIGITLEEQLFVERGQIMTPPQNRPICSNEFLARVFWMGKQPLRKNETCLLKMNTQKSRVKVLHIEDLFVAGNDVLLEKNASTLPEYGLAHISFKSQSPLAFQLFKDNAVLGRFVLIRDYQVLGSGCILASNAAANQADLNAPAVEKHHVFWEVGSVAHNERLMRQQHRSGVIWFTGLPSSGKSTLGNALERELFDLGCRTYRLDGDNLRHGLSRDLGFQQSDRRENIRRAGEVSKLLADAGCLVVASFVSPFQEDRRRLRAIFPESSFFEIHVDCSLETCEKRDVKGLYRKARQGEINDMTGISSDYEIPKKPDCRINTEKKDLKACVSTIMEALQKAGWLQGLPAVK
jgi:bifunctional enzyme CysN/CysC